MDEEKREFIDKTFPEFLKQLQPGTPHKWGMMNAQQMVEHLSDYVRVASGKNPAEVMTSEEHLPAYKKFLESEKQFRPETKNPLNPGAPVPVRLKDLQASIDEYLNEMKDFYSTFEKNPGMKTAHPAFGFLNHDEWIRLQYKHLSHHGRQFGLVEL